MKSGKLSDTALSRSVLQVVHKVNHGELVPVIGGGAATKVASAMQTVAGEGIRTGYLAAVRAVHSLAAKGWRSAFASVAITIPVTMEEAKLRRLVSCMGDFLSKEGIKIIGGHTEVSEAVVAPVVTVEMLAHVEATETATVSLEREETAMTGQEQTETADAVVKRRKRTQAQLRQAVATSPMDIVMSKFCGMTGAALLAGRFHEELSKRYPKEFVERAMALLADAESNEEAYIAWEANVWHAHAAAGGGIFGALWEMAEYAECGLTVDLRKLPILQETVEVCEYFDVNPYQLLSTGCYLFLTENGGALVRRLTQEGIPAAVIGHTKEGQDRIVTSEDEVRYLEPNRVEEYARATSNRQTGNEAIEYDN